MVDRHHPHGEKNSGQESFAKRVHLILTESMAQRIVNPSNMNEDKNPALKIGYASKSRRGNFRELTPLPVKDLRRRNRSHLTRNEIEGFVMTSS